MKKVLIIVLVLVFAGAVLTRNVFATEASATYAGYQLANPGMLPDSPLYVFKAIRDQLVGILVMGPVNKSFYHLLQADKRLLAGRMLVEGGKQNLGVVSVVNGEENFVLAVSEAESASKQGIDTSGLLAKLLVSATKHQEILNLLGSKVSGKNLQDLQTAVNLNQKSRERVLKLNTSN